MRCGDCGRYSLERECPYCEAGDPPPAETPRRSVLDGPAPEVELVYRFDREGYTPVASGPPPTKPPAPSGPKTRTIQPKPVEAVKPSEKPTIEFASVVKGDVEGSAVYCPCGPDNQMVAHVGSLVGVLNTWAPEDWVRTPYVYPERLLWYRCVGCGSITRETLVPAEL